MNKETVGHIYNGISLNYIKKKFEPVLVRWMSLEPIIESEVSQKEKNKYQILMHICMESRKTVLMNLFAGKEWRCWCGKWICGHSQGGRKWDKWRK